MLNNLQPSFEILAAHAEVGGKCINVVFFEHKYVHWRAMTMAINCREAGWCLYVYKEWVRLISSSSRSSSEHWQGNKQQQVRVEEIYPNYNQLLMPGHTLYFWPRTCGCVGCGHVHHTSKAAVVPRALPETTSIADCVCPFLMQPSSGGGNDGLHSGVGVASYVLFTVCCTALALSNRGTRTPALFATGVTQRCQKVSWEGSKGGCDAVCLHASRS